jgi:hypothetical protein
LAAFKRLGICNTSIANRGGFGATHECQKLLAGEQKLLIESNIYCFSGTMT